MNNANIINEFRYYPIDLQPYSSNFLDNNLTIYSNPRIEKRIIEMVEKSNILNSIPNKITNMINKKQIIVGYLEKNKFNFLYNKMKYLLKFKNTYSLGFFDSKSETIYIILDDNINIFGKEIFELDTIIAHELCHMASYFNKYTKIIERSYKDIIYPYYINFIRLLLLNEFKYSENDFNKYIKDNINKKYFLNLIKNLRVLETKTNKLNENEIAEEAKNIWYEYFIDTKLNKDISINLSEEIKNTYINFINSTLFTEKQKYIITYLIKAYEKIGIYNISSHVGQELCMISETICVTNQNGIKNFIIPSIKKIPN